MNMCNLCRYARFSHARSQLFHTLHTKNSIDYCDLIGAATTVAVEQVVYRQLMIPFLGWALILQVITPSAKIGLAMQD